MQTDAKGRGVINILAADKLMNAPKLYATFLLWLLSELFEHLPEVGDPRQAQAGVLLRRGAPAVQRCARSALLDKIEQVVRLIRSKGVGVYFVTQNPLDVPDTRAGPARQPRAARAARLHAARPEGGEDRRRRPCAPIRSSMSSRRSPSWPSAKRWSRCSTRRAAQASSSAPLFARRVAGSDRSRRGTRGRDQGSRVFGHYEQSSTANPPTKNCGIGAPVKNPRQPGGSGQPAAPASTGGSISGPRRHSLRQDRTTRRASPGVFDAAAKSAARSVGSAVGREIVRGVLGSILGGSSTTRRRR